MIEKTVLYLSRLNRYFSGNFAPVVCHAIGNKEFSNCICDCKDICKKTPGGTIKNNYKFNYVDNFDYELEMAELLKKKRNYC